MTREEVTVCPAADYSCGDVARFEDAIERLEDLGDEAADVMTFAALGGLPPDAQVLKKYKTEAGSLVRLLRGEEK